MSTIAANDTPESKKAVFRRLVDIYATGNLSALDEVIAPDYVGHASAGDRDLEGFRQSILYFHNLFIYDEDSFEVNDQFVEGEKVATRMTAHVKVRATGEPINLWRSGILGNSFRLQSAPKARRPNPPQHWIAAAERLLGFERSSAPPRPVNGPTLCSGRFAQSLASRGTWRQPFRRSSS